MLRSIEAKYQLLISKRKSAGLKYFDDSKDFIEYSNDTYDIVKIIIQIKNKIQ